MRGSTVKPILALTALFLMLPWAGQVSAQITLSWTAPADPTVAGYYLVWGTNSGTYTSTLTNPATSNSALVTGLLPNQVYYFNVADFNINGTESVYAGEIVLTNLSSSTNESATNGLPTTTNLSVFMAVTNGPPSPSETNVTISGNGGGGTVVNSTSTAGTNVAANFWGIPPSLTIVLSNGQPSMNIEGTVGSTLFIQTSTNVFSPDSWQTLTNISMTNISSIAPASRSDQAQDALDFAFVPAAEELPLSRTNPILSRGTFYRAMMPYDYVILADNVLTGQGYRPRMVLVNMPGIVCDDACYLSEGSSFIHYDRGAFVLQLEGSGPTIRAIATTLATSLGLDWTSASEFTYSNGVAQIVATVVQTEPASSDPVSGKTPPTTSSAIDF